MTNPEIARIIYPDGEKDTIEVNEENPVSVNLFQMSNATERDCALALIHATLNYLANLETEDPDELLSECGLSLDEDEITTTIMEDGQEIHFFGCDLG